jgi:hypothetical protein
MLTSRENVDSMGVIASSAVCIKKTHTFSIYTFGFFKENDSTQPSRLGQVPL